jgi:hypothetical protein
VSTNTFRLQYIAKAAAGVPRDLVNTFVSARIHPIRPTVLIYNCTWVCDAKCTMCNNWKWGDRKSDMTLAQLEPVMDSPFWGAVENLNISGGEPTTRLDLPEMVELFQPPPPPSPQDRHQHDRPHAGARDPDADEDRQVLRGEAAADQHPRLARRHRRRPRPGARGEERLRQGVEDDRRDAGAREGVRQLLVRDRLHDLREEPRGRREHPDLGPDEEPRRRASTCSASPDAMLHNGGLKESIGFQEREESFMRRFFLDRVKEESVLSGQAFMYLHYADMIANGYHRTMPCPFQSQGLLLNPTGDLHYCENSQKIGNVLDDSAESLYYKAENLAHRQQIKDEICPTCLSPCQVNVGAMKQFVPYAKFLKRAYQVKKDTTRHLETLPEPVGR